MLGSIQVQQISKDKLEVLQLNGVLLHHAVCHFFHHRHVHGPSRLASFISPSVAQDIPQSRSHHGARSLVCDMGFDLANL